MGEAETGAIAAAADDFERKWFVRSPARRRARAPARVVLTRPGGAGCAGPARKSARRRRWRARETMTPFASYQAEGGEGQRGGEPLTEFGAWARGLITQAGGGGAH